MPDVYLSIGSNVDRDQHISSVLAELEARFGPLTISSIYESQAVGFQGDPFYNLVVGFATDMPLQPLAAAMAELEAQHGRTRDSKKFAPRTLDIDIMLYGDRITQEGRLTLPRPEITEYAFMLEPLAEIAPQLTHPVTGDTFAALWAAYDKSRSQQTRVTPTWLKP